MRAKADVTSPKEARELDGVGPHAGKRLGHVLGELLGGAGLLDRRPLGTAALVHLLDEDAEAFGGSGVAGAQAPGLPRRRRSLQQQGACGVDLGDAGNVHLAGELGRGRDRHAQALERCVKLGGLGHGPGAACDQAERRAAELDAEARRARLGGEAERMVAFQHEA